MRKPLRGGSLTPNLAPFCQAWKSFMTTFELRTTVSLGVIWRELLTFLRGELSPSVTVPYSLSILRTLISNTSALRDGK